MSTMPVRASTIIEEARDAFYGATTPKKGWKALTLLSLEQQGEGEREQLMLYIESIYHTYGADLHIDAVPGEWFSDGGAFETSFADKHRENTLWRTLKGGVTVVGSPPGEWGRYGDEDQREVCLEPFEIHKYPVTQGLWDEVMGEDTNPSSYKSGPDFPVEQVSFFDACTLCNKMAELEGEEPPYFFLMEQEGDTPVAFTTPRPDWANIVGFFENTDSLAPRIPSEEEWEYACRAGTKTSTYNGDLNGDSAHDHEVLDPICWYNGNTEGMESPMEVGQKEANAWGIEGMLGNVWEWVLASIREWKGRQRRPDV